MRVCVCVCVCGRRNVRVCVCVWSEKKVEGTEMCVAILSERSHLSQFDVDSQQLLYLINLDLAKD